MGTEAQENTVQWGEPNVYVGLVMQRTDEGEAVVRVLAKNPAVEVIEGHTIVECRAKDRMILNYAELSDELGGVDVDGYWLQTHMSKHYGQLIMNDDEFILVADPREMVEAVGWGLSTS